jgi:hypothetical protein
MLDVNFTGLNLTKVAFAEDTVVHGVLHHSGKEMSCYGMADSRELEDSWMVTGYHCTLSG